MFNNFEQQHNEWLEPDEDEIWATDYFDDDIYVGDYYYDFWNGTYVLGDNLDKFLDEYIMENSKLRVAGRE